jgi:hypothetical protein
VNISQYVYKWLEQRRDKWERLPPNGKQKMLEHCGCKKATGWSLSNGRPYTNLKRVAEIICELAYGPKPNPKLTASHKTDEGCIGLLCIEPTHLSWETHRENMARESGKMRREAAIKANATRGNQISGLPTGIIRHHPSSYVVRVRRKWLGIFNSLDDAIAARNHKLVEMGIPIPD